jgi:hypothetical protein
MKRVFGLKTYASARLGILFSSVVMFVSFQKVSAQIQEAWVAHYNNGITNGTNQALKMVLDSAGNIYVAGCSQNVSSNLGYAIIKYAPYSAPGKLDRWFRW